VLRVDRDMSWDEIAAIVEEGADADRVKVAARVRKRFQAIKEKLRTLARAEGLLDEEP
jgi:hypothetical protein